MLVSKERIIKYTVAIECYSPYYELIKEHEGNAAIIRNAIAQQFINAGKGSLFEEMNERSGWSYREIKRDNNAITYECGFTSVYEY